MATQDGAAELIVKGANTVAGDDPAILFASDADRQRHLPMSLRSQFPAYLLFLLFAFTATNAQAALSEKQARKLIAKMEGMSLPGHAVRVDQVRSTGSNTAEATAELELVFRFTHESSGRWRINEIRTGQDRWEELDVIAQAAQFELPKNNCAELDQLGRIISRSSLEGKHARCLVASLFGVNLPSDAVRIKSVSDLGLPLGTEVYGLAVALVQADFRFSKDSSGWRVVALRTGNRDWVSLEGLTAQIDAVKRARATDELNTVAGALAAYSRIRGSFVVSDKESVLIDHLSPRYLGRVIRVDPWHNPYQYQGETGHFTLRSVGPDGKPDTADDIIVTRSLGTAASPPPNPGKLEPY
ncbi:MAG TPA: type II secretion system protein GspG [Pyrinomonadaceae bacterium]|nr:type II secretion system protein GspG [Pyrinomonadaceae bacterium]